MNGIAPAWSAEETYGGASYLVMYEEPWNVNVEILDGVSVVDECTVLSPEKVPNRLSATIIDQRSAAQYGQYSAPMYSISGLPPEVSGVPPLTAGILPVNEPPPSPIV